ncbi:LysM peptidoglycan-binding domain-containing protein [Psychrobacillus vulpis]|uniref:LysM peptidoglycan-binding domain-containing protein n=1 Tax=Psychrobacillus vulpis TaxID=2325572 RepID=A0A544TUE0_9BACI|nr:LysM peptidoglycan-binding domain-containing protein [Psychrobacillus vulpis]TQR21084.1 LysM peptidoglycan-binding domain-containing protein [Psychrobacillus vulpis]
MNNDDYQKKIDEHRQSIGHEDDQVESRRSRRATYSKKPKKKSKNLLLPSLFFVFILIPVCILIYVKFFYVPEVENEEVSSKGVIHVETKPISNVGNKEDNEESEDKEDSSSEKTETETNTETTAPKTEENDETNVEEPKQEQKEEVKTEPKEEIKAENQSKTHIVRENETLYRIAMNYYNNPDAVEKIKAANGLSSNNISAGQQLILP